MDVQWCLYMTDVFSLDLTSGFRFINFGIPIRRAHGMNFHRLLLFYGFQFVVFGKKNVSAKIELFVPRKISNASITLSECQEVHPNFFFLWISQLIKQTSSVQLFSFVFQPFKQLSLHLQTSSCNVQCLK